MPARRFGKYDVLARLATGGAANIFLARQGGAAGFHKLVCLKTLLPERAQDADFVAMFLDEARLAARLNHPNCVQIYDLGRVKSSYYISMEYIFGETLWNLLATVSKLRTPLPATHVAAIVASVCDGLHHAHELKDSNGRAYNLVHRDVSPQNVMITFEGQTKVVDFGIAKAETGRAATVAGIVKGKFSYMSPEQITGGQVDRRSDVYSLGIVLFECLASRRLYRGDTPEEIARLILEHRAPRLRDVVPETPAALDQICATALARHPSKRFQTAQAMGEALRDYLDSVRYAHSSQVIAKLVEERFKGQIAERRQVFEAALSGDHDEAHLLKVLDARPVRTIDLFSEEDVESEDAERRTDAPPLQVPDAGTAPLSGQLQLEDVTSELGEVEPSVSTPSSRREGPGWRIELEGSESVPAPVQVVETGLLTATDPSDGATRLDSEPGGAPAVIIPADQTAVELDQQSPPRAAHAAMEGPTRVDLDPVVDPEETGIVTAPREQRSAQLLDALERLDESQAAPRPKQAARTRGASGVRRASKADIAQRTSPTDVRNADEPRDGQGQAPRAAGPRLLEGAAGLDGHEPVEATVRRDSGHVRSGGSLDSALLPAADPASDATHPENMPFVAGPILVRPATNDVIPMKDGRTPEPAIERRGSGARGPLPSAALVSPAPLLTPAAPLATPAPAAGQLDRAGLRGRERYTLSAVIGALVVGIALGVVVGLLVAQLVGQAGVTEVPAVVNAP